MSFAARIVELGEELRAEGMQVGTSALLDAFNAIEEIGWSDQQLFREALSATLAKSPEDRRVWSATYLSGAHSAAPTHAQAPPSRA